MDLADQQVECTLIHPGYVQTDMTGESLLPAAMFSTASICLPVPTCRPIKAQLLMTVVSVRRAGVLLLLLLQGARVTLMLRPAPVAS